MKKIYFLLTALCFFTSVNAQIINFPDANFKAKLLTTNCASFDIYGNYTDDVDTNNDGEIQVSEAIAVTGLKLDNASISNLSGIDNFVNVIYLSFNNNAVSSVNLSSLTLLKDLTCSYNQLTNLDLSFIGLLHFLDCSHNSITNIILPPCYDEGLNVSYNLLNTIEINTLDYTIFQFDCRNNPNLTELIIKDAAIETIYDNQFRSPLLLSNCPNLQYVCARQDHIQSVQSILNTNGNTNCHINTYCSFTPGGTYYTIQGNSKIDNNNNGCDLSDSAYPNLKFNITNGTNTGSLISDITGNYTIPVQAGTHTITPVFENPSYFATSPSTATVTFPTQASPFLQNFCVTTNGVHPDLEVTLLPIIGARPGFDAKYKIIYKNKGNTTQSGTVNLTYDDSVIDLVVANPATTSQSINNLSWDFTNLLPFETREILVTLNVNSPLETPAVNNGYVLNYTAAITSVATDDLPNDNTFAYNQTVVNSFDPNDISCLEGATVTTAKVGDYVHYMIRFENKGTANAQNIVVKSLVDLAKYDINSIVPIKGSHSFVTNITSGNKAEFIFENINLPFDDANNDGNISFKIKIKSTLAAGDTFSKNASIYFDYNFPIVTNTATTTIQTLGIKDFEFSSYFSLFPNPATTILNISSKADIEISSISIYNTLGQIVLVIPNAQNTKIIDVSDLKTETYFIKINSDKGTSNSKFIKE